jgi:hypothetical protein
MERLAPFHHPFTCRCKLKPCSLGQCCTPAWPNRKISPKNRKIIGRLGCRGFQPEMSGAALTSFDKQLPSDQFKEVSICGVVSNMESLAAPSASHRAFPLHLNHNFLLPFVELSFNSGRNESRCTLRELQLLVLPIAERLQPAFSSPISRRQPCIPYLKALAAP